MDATQFAEGIDRQIVNGPLDELDSTLKHCWDADRLRELRRKLEEDYTRRNAKISARIDYIFGH